MTSQFTPRLTPTLRFPEFLNAEGWKENALATIGYFTGGGTPSRENVSFWNGDIPWISSSDISEESIFRINVSRYITEQAMRESASKLVPPLSILLISRLGVGKLAISQSPLCTSQDFISFTPTDVNVVFLAYLLKSRKDTLISFNQGTSIKGFTKDNIASLKLAFPSPPEQHRIAECLRTVDELIEAESQKLEGLKGVREGLMQQLFPREGEVTPRLRFPQFQNAPAWNAAKAGVLFAHRAEDAGPELPLYAVTINDGMVTRSSLDRHIEDVSDPSGNRKACKNDLTYNMMRMWQGALGVAPEDCRVSPAYVVLAPQDGVCSAFFQYLLKTPTSLQLLTSHSQGLTKDRLRLYYKDFATIALPCPAFHEQQMIASFLSSLDGLIAAQATKVDALQLHQRGLMQQLLPSSAGAEP